MNGYEKIKTGGKRSSIYFNISPMVYDSNRESIRIIIHKLRKKNKVVQAM